MNRDGNFGGNNMKFKIQPSRVVFWIFSVVMFCLFLTGLIFPEKTNYWIVLYGIPIMIMEFFSIFSTIILLLITNEDTEKFISVQTSGLIADKFSKKTNYWIAFTLVCIMTFTFSIFLGITFFLYFIVSSFIKYIGYRNIDSETQTKGALKSFGVQVLSLILGGLAALPLSALFGMFFSRQISLMYAFHQNLLEQQGHTGYAAVGVFAFWGMSYFILLITLDIFADYWEEKTGKPFVRPMDNKYLTTFNQPTSKTFREQSRLIQQQATKRNGEFSNNLLKNKPCSSFGYKDMKVFVGFKEITMGEDAYRPETTVKVKFQMTKNVKFLLYSKEIKLMMEWLVGIHKMEVDNPKFNDKFMIKTNDKDFSYNLLNHEVQGKLIDLQDNSFFPVLKITKDTFILVSRNCLDNEEEYDKLIDTSMLVLDKIRFSGLLKR